METDVKSKFLVWGIDNIAYGPVELPVLIDWISLGRVIADSWVFKVNEKAWFRAADLSELKSVFKSEQQAGTSAAATVMGIHPGSLRRIKMLADVDERLLASLLNYLEVVRVPAFTKVVSKGEHGDALFMVLEGELRAKVVIDGRETTLTTMGVGECFGELAIMDHEPRSADVVANQASVLIKVSADALQKMFTEAPALAAPFMFALARVIAKRVRAVTNRYQESVRLARTASEFR
jgi:CRP-like cAMP-binding protein